GGRRTVVFPSGVSGFPARWPRADDHALVKALARAHRWKAMMERGDYGSVAGLAAAEKINQSYLCRILRLTLLAPELVEAILDGCDTSPDLHVLLHPLPALWRDQAAFCPRERGDRTASLSHLGADFTSFESSRSPTT